jgi:hypothetical protein
MSILRLVERVMGEGDLHRDGKPVSRAGYELARYHELTLEDRRMTTTGEVVEGHLVAPPETLDALLGTSSPITLSLDDGRRFNLYVLNQDGTVTSADERGFY